MYSYGPPHMAVQKQDDQHEHTFSNYVRIQDVVQKTCLRRWTIGRSGERGSGISVLPARHDDDDDFKVVNFSDNCHLLKSSNIFRSTTTSIHWLFKRKLDTKPRFLASTDEEIKLEVKKYILCHKSLHCGGASGLTVISVGNGHGDQSSNLGRGC